MREICYGWRESGRKGVFFRETPDECGSVDSPEIHPGYALTPGTLTVLHVKLAGISRKIRIFVDQRMNFDDLYLLCFR